MIKVNDYDLSGEYGKCFIGSTFFIFDKSDYEKIKNNRWFLSGGYPATHLRGTGKIQRLHRFLTDCPFDKVVDHVNHNRLDNRRENLRVCTSLENNKNLGVRRGTETGHTGIALTANKKRWTARICNNGTHHYLGTYDTLEEAIKARKEAEKKYYGDFAYKGGER